MPIYESATRNATEGGGTPGQTIALVDVASGTPSVATLPPPPANFRPHGAAWTREGGLLVTAQLLNKVSLTRPRLCTTRQTRLHNEAQCVCDPMSLLLVHRVWCQSRSESDTYHGVYTAHTLDYVQVLYFPNVAAASTPARELDFGALGCSTPHLVDTVPRTRLGATACRCTNPGDTEAK